MSLDPILFLGADRLTPDHTFSVTATKTGKQSGNTMAEVALGVLGLAGTIDLCIKQAASTFKIVAEGSFC